MLMSGIKKMIANCTKHEPENVKCSCQCNMHT